MTQLFSATTKKISVRMTIRNRNIISFLKRHENSTLADVANRIQLPFSTALVELKYLNKLGFVNIEEENSKKEDKELIEAMIKIKPKSIKKRKQRTKKKKQKPEDKYTADLDKWMK